MPTGITRTPNAIDRNASSANRVRRNFQRLADGAAVGTIKVTAPISNAGGSISLTLNSAGGLYNNSGLSVKLADTSLVESSSGLAVNPATAGGLQVSSGLLVRGFRTSATSPLATDGDDYYDTAKEIPYIQSAGVVQSVSGKLYATLADSSPVANTTIETILNNAFTFPANFFTAGKTVRIYASCLFGATGISPSSPNLAVKVKIGTTTFSTESYPVVTTSGARVSFEIITVCRTTGVTGSFGRSGFALGEGAVGGTGIVLSAVGGSPVTMDTTTTQTVTITAQWSVADPTDTIVLHQLTIEALN